MTSKTIQKNKKTIPAPHKKLTKGVQKFAKRAHKISKVLIPAKVKGAAKVKGSAKAVVPAKGKTLAKVMVPAKTIAAGMPAKQNGMTAKQNGMTAKQNGMTAKQNAIPAKLKKTRKPSTPKQKKIKKVFTPYNPIQPAQSNGKPVNTSKKEPKGRFELEYVIRCSEPLLYEFITSPSGLSEWFSDDVNIRDGIYTFYWNGSEQKARLVALKEGDFIRYQWLDKSDGSYFEFRIQTDDLTGDVSLIIVDFADNDDEQLSSKLLWDSQVDKLMNTIGSHS